MKKNLSEQRQIKFHNSSMDQICCTGRILEKWLAIAPVHILNSTVLNVRSN